MWEVRVGVGVRSRRSFHRDVDAVEICARRCSKGSVAGSGAASVDVSRLRCSRSPAWGAAVVERHLVAQLYLRRQIRRHKVMGPDPHPLPLVYRRFRSRYLAIRPGRGCRRRRFSRCRGRCECRSGRARRCSSWRVCRRPCGGRRWSGSRCRCRGACRCCRRRMRRGTGGGRRRSGSRCRSSSILMLILVIS